MNRFISTVYLAFLTTVLVTATASSAPASTPNHVVIWHACSATEFKGSQCGTVQVPVDWSRPAGDQIQLALVRRPADNQAHKLGTLFLNNGSGASAIQQLRLALKLNVYTGVVATRFDTVAIDQRGVGQSAPVRCGRPLRSTGVTYVPTTQVAFALMVKDNQALYAACRANTGPVLDHLDLESTARDFDAVRDALGQAQVTWYGITASTLLGRTYAKLFPGRLRALALDTALDDTLPPEARLLREVRTVEESFNRFLTWCALTPPTPAANGHPAGGCALQGQNGAERLTALAAQADANPPATPGNPSLSGEDVRHAVQLQLVQRLAWPLLGSALQQGLAGNGALLTINPDDTYDALQDHAVSCATTPSAISTITELQALQRQVVKLAPNTRGATGAWQTAAGCIGWPNRPPQAEPPALTVVPPTLIMQSTHQSLSAYENGPGLAHQFPGSVVLTRQGDDYSMFLFSPCVANYLNAFLIQFTLPDPETVCYN